MLTKWQKLRSIHKLCRNYVLSSITWVPGVWMLWTESGGSSSIVGSTQSNWSKSNPGYGELPGAVSIPSIPCALLIVLSLWETLVFRFLLGGGVLGVLSAVSTPPDDWGISDATVLWERLVGLVTCWDGDLTNGSESPPNADCTQSSCGFTWSSDDVVTSVDLPLRRAAYDSAASQPLVSWP